MEKGVLVLHRVLDGTVVEVYFTSVTAGPDGERGELRFFIKPAGATELAEISDHAAYVLCMLANATK